MPVEIIGWIAPRVSSELIPSVGRPFDPDVIDETARIHEAADFDRVLVGYFSDAPDGFLVAARASVETTNLKFLLAHRPGFVSPTLAARKLATLDQLTAGRLAVHLIAGGSDIDQAKDGDFADHSSRYRRMHEYVKVLRKSWTENHPFDHEGEFYRVNQSYSDIRCLQNPHIPIYGGGGSEAAIQALAASVNVFMLWGEPLSQTRAFISKVRNYARTRPVGFSVSTRPILARTDAEAWDRAHTIYDQIAERLGDRKTRQPQNEASKRLLHLASDKEIYDSCLWTRLAELTGAPGNSTALVGSPDTVAKALFEYYRIGATSLLIRGYDPLSDASNYGEDLIPRVRRLVARADAG